MVRFHEKVHLRSSEKIISHQFYLYAYVTITTKIGTQCNNVELQKQFEIGTMFSLCTSKI